jgi:hypothetical protein
MADPVQSGQWPMPLSEIQKLTTSNIDPVKDFYDSVGVPGSPQLGNAPTPGQ